MFYDKTTPRFSNDFNFTVMSNMNFHYQLCERKANLLYLFSVMNGQKYGKSFVQIQVEEAEVGCAYDGVPGLEEAGPLRVLHHPQRYPILHAPTRVQVLALRHYTNINN